MVVHLLLVSCPSLVLDVLLLGSGGPFSRHKNCSGDKHENIHVDEDDENKHVWRTWAVCILSGVRAVETHSRGRPSWKNKNEETINNNQTLGQVKNAVWSGDEPFWISRSDATFADVSCDMIDGGQHVLFTEELKNVVRGVSSIAHAGDVRQFFCYYCTSIVTNF
jgi:hypothetical protein